MWPETWSAMPTPSPDTDREAATRWREEFTRMGTIEWAKDLGTGKEWGVDFVERHGKPVPLSPDSGPRGKK
jgi:hypothetical protein